MFLKMHFLPFLLILNFLSQVSFAGTVEIKVELWPTGSFVATSKRVSGHALLKGDQVAAKGIRVDMKSFDTGIKLRDQHFQKYLEADKFPYAELVLAKGKDGKGVAKIKVKGIENEVKGTYVIEGSILEATFKTSVKAFGIEDVSYKGVGVEDEVEVIVKIPVKKAGERVPQNVKKKVRKSSKRK